ncbi:MAG TPA: SGNH/GDSL hydrolase family protein [Candidatus Saccharimonadales bacterium]|nr:SGNH/GDSL hydrolase family protein [Candidatus Saccharimonadales bacterium]
MSISYKLVASVAAIIFVLIGFGIMELLVVVFNGGKVPVPDIPREPFVQGKGPALNYVILGDSTAVGQGTDYAKGIVRGTTAHLAVDHKVTMVNLAVSGATTQDVLRRQLPTLQQKPDVILIAIGANDVTHLTLKRTVQHSLEQIVTTLLQRNCNAKIVLTGSPAMGSVPRFPQPLRWVAGRRVTMLNDEVFRPLAQSQQLTFAPIAEETGPIFSQDPTLFAVDKFHPNDRGYAVWLPVLNKAIDQALASQPSHCAE